VAFLVEAEGGRLLFDTGQSGSVLLHNLDLLHVEPSSIDAVAISHGHYDHTGGLPMLLEHLHPGTPLYANPDLFRERYSERRGGSTQSPRLESVGISGRHSHPLTRQALADRMSLILNAEPQEIFSGVWTTGQITERPEIEGRSKDHRMREGDRIVPDAYLDDMALVLEMDGHSVLLCGCCHAGLLNTLSHAVRMFGRPVEIVVGGLHLTGASEVALAHICTVLGEHPALKYIYPNHCTGEAAVVALTNAFGASVVRVCLPGTTVEWSG
jgi:7,8-dihydropterin-6-yl-methyl-4-(beta-D-ribofuranosyl)aminobenzene 5'-phosphate synthase